MKTCVLFLLLLVIASCQTKSPDINPDSYFTVEEADQFKYAIIRYMGKLPGKANHKTKFNEAFDEYYMQLADQHDLLYYYSSDTTDAVYFVCTRIAPSLHVKKVAIGGRVVFDVEGDVIAYEETFRTWKMPVDELQDKTMQLFDIYIRGGDLSPYYYENSQPDEYIEFPNEETYFDASLKRWETAREDPLEEYYKLKEGSENTD